MIESCHAAVFFFFFCDWLHPSHLPDLLVLLPSKTTWVLWAGKARLCYYGSVCDGSCESRVVAWLSES